MEFDRSHSPTHAPLPSEDESENELGDLLLHATATLNTPIDSIRDSITVQPTDAVKQILAQARDSLLSQDIETDREFDQEVSVDANLSDASGGKPWSEDLSDVTSLSAESQPRSSHIFILSEAGKPIYSRYGDESQLASIMGVMQALMSFVSTSGDELHSIEATGKHFIFLRRPHLILVAVGRDLEVKQHLLICLGYAYAQILSLLTLNRLNQRFEAQQNLDLRRWLTDGNRLISSLLDFVDTSFGGFIQSVSYLPLSPNTREAIARIIIQSVKSRDVVFGLLMCRTHLISLVSMRDQVLHPLDIHLLINLVYNSNALKSAQTHWIPICLPKFDANGFLYAFVSFANEDVALVLLSVDSTQFYALDDAKNSVFKQLQSVNNGDLLNTINAADCLSLSEIEIPSIRHLLFKSVTLGQFTCTEWSIPYSNHSNSQESSEEIEDLRDFVRLTYRRIHTLLHYSVHPVRMVFKVNSHAAFFAWKTDTFELFCTLDPLITKTKLGDVRRALTKWLGVNKQRLFSFTSHNF